MSLRSPSWPGTLERHPISSPASKFKSIRTCLPESVSWLPQAVAAMQFFYHKVLQRDWKIAHCRTAENPAFGRVFTPQEVSRLLEAAQPGKARMLFTTMYGCGLRVSEGIALEVTDIDSQRKVIHIRQGKGRKDRYVPLGENLLGQLRDYWRIDKPSRFLFPGTQGDKPWNVTAVRQEFRLRCGSPESKGLHHPHAAPQLRVSLPAGRCEDRHHSADSWPCKP